MNVCFSSFIVVIFPDFHADPNVPKMSSNDGHQPLKRQSLSTVGPVGIFGCPVDDSHPDLYSNHQLYHQLYHDNDNNHIIILICHIHNHNHVLSYQNHNHQFIVRPRLPRFGFFLEIHPGLVAEIPQVH